MTNQGDPRIPNPYTPTAGDASPSGENRPQTTPVPGAQPNGGAQAISDAVPTAAPTSGPNAQNGTQPLAPPWPQHASQAVPTAPATDPNAWRQHQQFAPTAQTQPGPSPASGVRAPGYLALPGPGAPARIPTSAQTQPHAVPVQREPQYARESPSLPYAQPQPAQPSAQGWQPIASGATQGGAPAPARTARRTPWFALVAVAIIAALLASVTTSLIVRDSIQQAAPTTTARPSTTNLGTSAEDSVEVPVASSSNDNPQWQDVSAAVAPSVVAIQISTQSGGGVGSGVIVDSKGLVLTNDHVVGDASSVYVTLDDGRIYEATIVGTDPTTDLAVVQLKDAPDDLKSAVFADSDAVRVGDPVMAMGNPLGLSNTATTGIVSALNRPVTTSSTDVTSRDVVVTNAIQIDAAVNPGNSGGPLFNAAGEVIGITSSIATLSDSSTTGGSIGLGFAIPSNVADLIGGQLIDSGKAEHAFLGVSLSDAQATADGVTRKGARVEQVIAGSPAERAALQTGDVVIAVDGQAVSGFESLTAFVRSKPSGTTVELTLVRDGKLLDVSVALETRADS